MQKISVDGLFIALTFVATFFLVFPLPAVGYFNIGDVMILLGGAMFGPVTGALSAIGAGLADLALGYALYFPFTLVVKAVEGLMAGLLCYKKKTGWVFFAGIAIAGISMPVGYFLSEWLVLPLLDAEFGMAAAIVSIPLNTLQFAISSVIACVIYALLKKVLDQRQS